jgi:hypothetical protein
VVVGFVGAGFPERGARVSIAALVSAAESCLCVLRAGACAAAAGVSSEGLGAASFGAASATFDAAEERDSGGRGHRFLLFSWCADLIVSRRRRGLVGIDIFVVGRALVRTRLVSEERRRTGCLIVPMIARWPASGCKRVC